MRVSTVTPARRACGKTLFCQALLCSSLYFTAATHSFAATDGPIEAVQEALMERDIYWGEVTGTVDGRTRAALREFQRSEGLRVTGEIDTPTIKALQQDPPAPSPEALDRVAGVPPARIPIREEAMPPNPSNPGAPEPIGEGPGAAVMPPSNTAKQDRPRTLPGEVTTAEARQLVRRYLQAVEDGNPETEGAVFGETVDYFDSGKVDRDYVVREQLAASRRWPVRDFKLIGQPEVVKNFADAASVRFFSDYSFRRGDTKSHGRIEGILLVRRTEDGLRVIGVRERKVN